MSKFLFLFVFSIAAFFSNGQKVQFENSDSLMGEFDQFSIDNFGRIYVTKGDVIIQFSNQLDTLFTASLKTIRPTSIESSKSFRTLVFDQDRSVIQFLDNTLTDIHGQIDLVNLDIQQPILVCESFGGNTIWVLDAGAFRLVKLNANLEKILITENLLAVFEGEELPIQMKEVNDLLYVLIPNKGIALFDVFGTFMDIYPCNARSFDAMGQHLFIQTENSLEIIPTEGVMEPEFVYPISGEVISFAYSREKVYLHKKEGLFIGNFIKTK
ncbi:MAG: hypothetical protein R2780_00575 [Crocinitomicaceae bacterium]|nr:hypothetical protein [Crocinitomicaceae bacterium]